ncbi:GTPase Era [Patescibacteria group bacterium]|jgi:GTP-binding protein Era|nr:GTPase Era [Patescibacteria group bacterium]
MKSGFVVLAGRSNVGKSSLLNALVGTKVAIVTPKPQTTRRPVRGILHDKRGQIVFVDTPGVFLGKKDALSQKLNALVREQLEGIDLVVYVMDPTREAGAEEEDIRKLLRKLSVPIIAAINKSDLPENEKPALDEMRNTDVGQRTTLEISAMKRSDLNRLVDTMFALLPEGEAFYPDQQLTDVTHKDWLAETIREKCFLRLEKELPYSIMVEVTEAETPAPGKRHIEAVVWTTDDRYKKMVIGSKGSMIKQIGMDARKEIEAATGDQVYLKLEVKTDPKWPQRFSTL